MATPSRSISRARAFSSQSTVEVVTSLYPKKGESFEDLFPEIAKEWDHKKNLQSPRRFKYGSGFQAHWICSEGHQWKAAISVRTLTKSRCSECATKERDTPDELASLGDVRPDLIKYWAQELNGDVTIFDVRPNSSKFYYWHCGKGHDATMEISRQAKRKNPEKCTSDCI